jgi:hypothetical protein|tara:strand:+ start:443 stop:679 length:237 start_codon:yes stop_codon:yes gene_type:complete
MAKQPGQFGQNAVWDGPYKAPESSYIKGNPKYGDNCMKVTQFPLPYKAGPISSIAQSQNGGSLGKGQHISMYQNPTAK